MTLSFAPPPTPVSSLSRLDPRWKLAGLGISLVAVAGLRLLPATALALAGALLLAWLGRLPARWLAARLGLVLLLLAPFVLLLPWIVPGGFWPGVRLALALACKALALMTLALVLLTTSPLTDTLKAAHALRVPGFVVQLFALTYRYVFLVAAELVRLRIALRARGYRNRPTWHSYRTVGHVAGMLLVRGHERGERVSQAMRSRGFDGQFRSLSEFRTRGVDALFFLAVTASALLLLAWDVFGS
jgi:cobalt/nickel transport system permease protein